jgi:hypothetical protein
MNKYVKVIVAVAVIAGYYLLLRYVAPSREPYFILGIGLIGYVAWLYGVAAGLGMTLFLTPLTLYTYDQFEVSISYDGFAYSPAYIALEILTAATMGHLRNKTMLLSKKETILMEGNENLQNALSKVREMGGIHSLCTSCKSILDDDGTWTKIDSYLKEKTKAEFSHGICPECAEKFEVPSGPTPA